MPLSPYMLMPSQGSDPADEWNRLGFEAQLKGNLPEAQNNYNQAMRCNPRHAMAAQNLAIVFAQSNMLNDAMLTMERAEMMDGQYEAIPMNLALMAMDAERIDEALAASKRAVEKAPENVDALFVLAMVLPTAGKAEESVAIYDRILAKKPNHPAAGSNACFVQTLTDCGPKELLEQRTKWWETHHFKGTLEPHTNSRTTDRPLRVGYVGGDFKGHSAAFIFARVLLHHSKDVEPYFYSSLPVDPEKDFRTKQFADAAGAAVEEWTAPDGSKPKRPAGGRWRDISTLTDEQAAKLIREDKIDILVDLAGHTGGGRLALFTYKPAPVQVTAWGFAHGTGCPEMDYFLADPVAVPLNERQHFTEKIYDLPCIVTMEPPKEYMVNGTSKLPLRKNGYITFGSFARYEKMTDACLRTFAEILKRVPDSRLVFKDHAYKRPYSIRRVMEFMEGIEPERLLFSVATDHRDHLLAYQQCDIFLNPFPHSSGVVSCEVLWMGVPMITLRGKQPGGRTGASVLTAMGRPEWIANTPEEYVDKAVGLAESVKVLADVRKTLQAELLKSAVYTGYVEAVEAGYKEMWKQWVDGQKSG